MTYQVDKIKQLPIEITREIFTHILLQHPSVSTPFTFICHYNKASHHSRRFDQDKSCVCWQLDLLSVTMVCKSWYLIGLELMQSRQALNMSNNNMLPWLPLVNHASYQRTYPFRARLARLLKESSLTNHVFHQQVQCLVIDFASFDTISREKLKSSNTFIKRKRHYAIALADIIELIHLCTNTERLNIICDAEFSSLVNSDESSSVLSHENSILSNSLVIKKAISQSVLKIKRLDFVGYSPIQRCPCCASKKWDMHLVPLIQSLPHLQILVLQHVLPSAHIFKQLAMNPYLEKIVFYKSIVTVPSDKRSSKIYGKSREYVTSINQVPTSIWHTIKSVEIYEDIEDAATWRSERYLKELVAHVGPQLERFVLQFGTKKENELCIEQGFSQEVDSRAVICDPNSPLNALKAKCKDALTQISLVNVPEFEDQ